MAKYPSIPSPNLAPESLRDSVVALKQDVEMLTGQTGDPLTAAVTRGDLVDLGLVTKNAAALKAAPYQPPQSVQGLEVDGIALYDASGVARMPAIQLSWPLGVLGVQGIRYRVRLASDESDVTSGYFDQAGASTTTITESILPATTYQVSTQYISKAAGEQLWSAWENVTTPDVRIGIGSIDASIAAQVTTILDANFADVRKEIAKVATVATEALARTFRDKTQIRSQQQSLYGNNRAFIENVQTTAADADAAMASDITALFAGVDSSHGLINQTAAVAANNTAAVASLDATVAAEIGPSGALRASVTSNTTAVSTLNGYAAASYSVTLDVNGYATGYKLVNGGGGISAFTVVGANFYVAFPGVTGGSAVPVFAVSNVGGVAKVALRGDMIVDGSITATKIAAGTITASQIAAGTITASQIAAGTITASQIAAGAINTTQLAVNSVDINAMIDGAASNTGGFAISYSGSGSIVSGTLNIQSGRAIVLSNLQIGGGTSSAFTSTVSLYIDGVLKKSWSFDGALSSTSTYTIPYPVSLSWLETGLSAGSHTFELRNGGGIASATGTMIVLNPRR